MSYELEPLHHILCWQAAGTGIFSAEAKTDIQGVGCRRF